MFLMCWYQNLKKNLKKYHCNTLQKQLHCIKDTKIAVANRDGYKQLNAVYIPSLIAFNRVYSVKELYH
jgi:hypothetical protein